MLIADLITVFLACFGMVQQYMTFVNEKSVGKFSIYVTAFLIFATIFKAMFYFITPYGTALFVQNFLVIGINLMVIHKFIELGGNKAKHTGSLLNRFWQWPTFAEYVSFLVYFTLIVGFITYQSIANDWVAVSHIMASVATIIEICIAIPQVIAIWRSKSAQGVSKGMILIWLLSDSYKTVYFILKNQPLAFIATGSCQFLLDIVLVAQLIMYRERTPKTKCTVEQQFLES